MVGMMGFMLWFTMMGFWLYQWGYIIKTAPITETVVVGLQVMLQFTPAGPFVGMFNFIFGY